MQILVALGILLGIALALGLFIGLCWVIKTVVNIFIENKENEWEVFDAVLCVVAIITVGLFLHTVYIGAGQLLSDHTDRNKTIEYDGAIEYVDIPKGYSIVGLENGKYTWKNAETLSCFDHDTADVPRDIIFYGTDGRELLKITQDGDFYVNGEKTTRDIKVYRGLVKFLKLNKCY